MTSLLNNIGRSLLISCMIPAMIFVTVSLLIFAPQLPTDFLVRFNVIPPSTQPGTSPSNSSASPPNVEDTLADFTGVLALILIISFVLAYVLMIMNWVVVRVFEGYYIPKPIRNILTGIQERRKFRFARRVHDNEQGLEEVTEGTELYQQHWRRYIELKNEYHELFPSEARNTLPTRLGNVYRAFEDYSFKRYGMEGLFFWERLGKVIPEGYAGRIEDLNNSIAFLLNTSLASIVVAGEILLKDFIDVDVYLINMTLKIGPISLNIPISLFHGEFPGTKILLSLLCLGLGYFFYHAAVSTARNFGRYVRTCYDLFRLDLLDELNVERPTTLGGQEERALWRSVHEFLALGEGTPYKEPISESAMPGLIDALRPLKDFVRLSVQLRLWRGVSFLLERFTAFADRSRFRSRYVVINDGAE
jgi:hypothetical protein